MRKGAVLVALCVAGLVLSFQVQSSAQEETQDAARTKLDVLNHLTQAVAGMMEGASAESVRKAIVQNLRHDPNWGDAKELVDAVVQLCSDGASIQSQIESLQERAASDQARAEAQQTASDVGNLISLVDLFASGGSATSFLRAAPTLLSEGHQPRSSAEQSLAAKEQEWRRELAAVGLKLERAKERLRQEQGYADGEVIGLADAQLFMQILRDSQPGDETEARRQLLLLARAKTRFPELQHQLGVLYQKDNPRRARRYFNKAIEQSGDILREDRVSGHSAFAIGYAALGDATKAEDVGKESDKYTEALDWGQRALKYQPRSTDAHVLVALAQARTGGDLEDLLISCEEILEIDPDHAWAHAILVDTLVRSGESSEAMAQLGDLLRRHPGYAHVPAWSRTIRRSEEPTKLVETITPRIELNLERAGDRVIPVVKNVGLVPLIGVRAVISAQALNGEGGTAASEQVWDRLDPSEAISLSQFALDPRVAARVLVRLYCANGYAVCSNVDLKGYPAFVSVPHRDWQAWTPARGKSQDGSIAAIFQVVRTAGRALLYVKGRGPSLTNVRVGISIGDSSGAKGEEIECAAWPIETAMLIPLPLSFLAALEESQDCTYFIEASEGSIRVSGQVESGTRSMRLILDRVAITKEDFLPNDDGENASPELVVVVRLNKEKILTTQDNFAQDSYTAQWSEDNPSCEFTFTKNDVLTVVLVDMDLMEHDKLAQWELRWKQIAGWGRSVELTTHNGGKVVFRVERLP